jgi:serine/threonine-protein kinase
LIELEAAAEAIDILKEIPDGALSKQRRRFLEIALLSTKEPIGQVAKEALKQLKNPLQKSEIRTFLYLLRQALKKSEPLIAREILTQLKKTKIPAFERVQFDSLELWTYLLKQEWKEAYALIEKFPTKTLNHEHSPLHFPYGCLLYATEGPEIALTHFGGVMETPYPSTTALPSFFLTGRINEKKGWIQRAFWWEKKELYRQIDLFYKTIGKDGKTKSRR